MTELATRESIRQIGAPSAIPVQVTSPTVLPFISCFIAGAVLGLSAPGLEQWYIAWIGLIPLFYFCFKAESATMAAIIATCFGTAYNLVCLQWYMQVRSSAWGAVFAYNPAASCLFAWITMAFWQGLFFGALVFAIRKLPLTGGWLLRRDENGRWFLPTFLVAPLLWVMIIDKLANHPNFLGVPWSLLEYSQYRQIELLQSASVIGGSGIAAAIVLANLLLASLLGLRLNMPAALRFGSRREMLISVACGGLLLLMLPLYGAWRLREASAAISGRSVTVHALQGNLSSSVHKVSSLDVAKRYIELSIASPPGICVWPEWSLPVDWSAGRQLLPFFAQQAKGNNQTWIVGGFDLADRKDGRRYNSVGAFDVTGKIFENAYHKRYLVPFGEYIPAWIYYSPLREIFDPEHKVLEGVLPGQKSIVFRSTQAAVAPLVCFENVLPGYSAQAVREGAELLVDCSNTGWFERSILGDQMVAFSVMRAAENHRSFVFCTLLGPSAIIDSNGRILRKAPYAQATRLSATVPAETDITIFSRLCRF